MDATARFVKRTAPAVFSTSITQLWGATREDLKAIADLVRGTNIAVFSDGPYYDERQAFEYPRGTWNA